MRKLRHIINVFLFVFTVTCVFGQSEDELKESATKLFEKEQYVEATSYYLRLLSLNPKNADYNFRYGTCLLFNSYQKVEAIRYLSYAIAEPGIDPRAFYFYGRALHLNYQFEDAIKFYRKFIDLREKKDKRYNVEREIEMCENGKKLLVTFTDIIVSEKKEIEEDKFFRLYKNMETIGGDILVSAEFQSKVDKKNGHVPIVHFPPRAKAIYYSSYGDSEDNGLDIYIRRRLPDGSWGEPQILPGQVNSPEDEDFPYMHPSGDFLYFSSKGHNSMGGYDVFLSRYNPDINAFGKPENVDFAISSPDDDFFYVVDSLFKSAYFASARQSQNGKLHVYNVRVARVPIQEVIVMGDFISEINPNNETMRITVTSNSNGAEVGKIVSNQKGKYSFVFPKGGKYNYEITVDGNENNTYKYLVELPFLDEFKPLKQKAIHKMVDGEEIVTIINLFDEDVEGAEAIIAEVIRKKSSLEVNVDDFDLKELEKIEARNKTLAEIGFNNMSMPEVSSQLNTLAENEKKRSEVVERIESNLDLAIIANSSELAKLDTQLKEILDKANQTSDPIEKHNLLMQAKTVESELNQLTAEVDLIHTMKNELLQQMGAPSTSGVGKIEVIENQFNVLISSGKEDDALALLVKNKTVIQKAKNESPEKYVSELVEKSLKLNEDIKSLKKQQVEFELNESSLVSQINQLKNQLIDAKKKEAEQIQSQIKDKENELVMVKEVLADTKKRIIEKNTELNALNNSIETLQKAMVNTDLAAYNKSEVEEVLKKAKQVESDVNAAHLDSQINEIERENPELNPEYVPIDSGENTLAEIQNDYNKKVEEIQSNSNLSEEEKLNLQQKANNESVANVNRRINAIERELSVTPDNEALIAEQNSLNEYKNELETENERLNSELLAFNNSNVNQSNVLESVKSELENRIAEIKSDNSISEEEKINLQKQANNESISLLENRIEEVKSELRSNPNNSSFKNELSALNQYKASIESENQSLDNELLVLNSTSDINDLVAIQNGLNEKLSSIQSDNSKSEEEKIIAQQQANKAAITQIEERLSQIENILKNDPNNASLKNEKTALNEYKDELATENKQLNTELLALKNSTANQQNQLASIQSDLKEKTNEIQSNNSLSEAEKIKQLQQANNETIAKIEQRIQEIDNQLSSNPSNASLKSEKVALENYKSELQSENLSLNSDLIALNNETSPESNQLESLQSDLKVKVNEIQSNTSLSEEEKIKLLQQANNETIAEVNERVNTIENQLSSDPDNTALFEEQLALVQYKNSLEQENNELAEQLLAYNSTNSNNNVVTVTKEEVLNSVQSDYQDKVSEIQSDNSLSELEKLNQLQELDQKLITSLQKENTSNNKSLNKQPTDQNLQAKKEIIENLIAQKQNEVEERAQIINAKSNISSVVDVESVKTELLKSVNPEYADKKVEIENSNSTEFEKVEALLELEVEQLNQLKEKQTEIERSLKRNSSDEQLLAEQQAINSLVKDQEQVVETLKSDAVKSIPSDVVAEKVNQADPNYVNDIETIKSENNAAQQEAIIERENELQEKLIAKIEEKEKALNRSYSVSVDLERMTFEKALEESKERVENAADNNNVQNEGVSTTKDAFIAEIRSTNSTEIEKSLQANPVTKSELEKADQVLAQYENELKERIATVESELRISPTEELTAQKEWLDNELEEVQKKRRQFSVSIGELETDVVANNQNDAQLNKLAQEEQSILEKLNDPNTSNAEKKELQAQLNEVATEKVTLENKATELAINENKKENEQLTTNLNQLETNSNIVDKAKEFNTEENQAIEDLTVQASKAKTEEEKKFLLTEAEERQNLLNSTLKEIVNNEKQVELEKEEGIKISSREELENQKRKFTIQIGELTTEIVATEKQIDKAKKKDIPALETRKQQLINQRSLLEMQLRTIEERIVQEDQLISVAAENSLNENITFNEERKLAGTEEYKEYYELASKTLDTERELSLLEQELMKEQKKVRSLLETQLANENEPEIQLSVSNIKTIQEKIDRLKIEHVQQKYAAEQKLSSNPEDAIRMQNLVLRDVQPIEATSVAASLIAMPSNGFEIKTDAPSTYSAENPIPIDVESPSGLYYRVQIGAFAKPIPQDLFKEFTPVSGEKIEGSNIVRYMAGFFNNSNIVVDARAKIRALGYSDAFIVAYCDGKRIGFGEARRLEAQGLCVPKGENELVMEVVTKTAEKLGLPTTTEVQEVPELSYNQSPGAVKADPIELKKGLFFTTQVGVYNRPIAAESVFGMEELITLRLPNGQIRYSSGTFNSIEEAKPRRTEALNKGIKGAFITAYYKGERISLTEAKRLLEENGNAILQSEIEKTEKVEEVIVPKNAIRTDSVNVEKTTKVIASPKEQVQIVSQNQYATFPTEVLNKFNMEGNFYYDTKDKRIKSIIYKGVEDLPNLTNLRNEIDTLYLIVDETKAIDEQVIIVKTNTTVVPGDFMDWLMRQPFQREFILLDDKVEIRLKGIEPNQIGKVQEDIRTFVLEMEVRNVSEVEFESLK